MDRPDDTRKTTEPAIGLAVAGDAGAISRMSRDLIEPGLPWTWRAARVLQAIRAPEVNVAVARQDGELVGFGIMEYLEADAYLALFAVRAESQRTGVGSALIHWLEASAAAAGAGRIRLDARRDNVPARSFYNEHGYHETEIRRGRYGGDVDGVQLEKWLRMRP